MVAEETTMPKTSRTLRWPGMVASALAAVALVVGSAALTARQADQAELLMQAARNRQVVEGKLDEAITIYQDVLAKYAQNRPVAARALAALGQCYEKLGAAQTTEARRAYERIVQQYPEQKEAVAQARARLAALASAAGAPASPTLTVRRVLQGDIMGQVSPDGRFVSCTWGEDVAISDLATGQRRRLTEESSSTRDSAFAEESVPSPDGKSVAYAWRAARYDLRVVGVDGSKPRVLRAGGDGIVRQVPRAWSPDSRHVLAEVVKADGTRDMLLVAVADGSAKLLKAVGKNPSPGGVFSPDGRYVAWATTEGISLYELRTGSETPLIPDRSNHSVMGWAPDGKYILFSSERRGSADAWLIAVADGKAQGEPVFVRKDLGRHPMGFTHAGAFYYAVNNNVGDARIVEVDPVSGDVVSPPQPASRRGNIWFPDWSPDGRSLAYVFVREPNRTVVVRALDTNEEREYELGERTVGLGAPIRWLPDGKGIAIPAFEPGRGESLVRIDVQTGRITNLMPLPAGVGFPKFGFAPDGHTVFYGKPGFHPDSNAGRVVARDLTSGRETDVVAREGLYTFALSPDGRRLVVGVNEGGDQILFVTPVVGGEARQLLRIDGKKGQPFWGSPWWTPDGRYVAFLRGVEGKVEMPYQARRWQMWRVAADGGEPQRLGLTVGRQIGGLRPHPDGRRLATTDFESSLEIWVMEHFLPNAAAASGAKVK